MIDLYYRKPNNKRSKVALLKVLLAFFLGILIGGIVVVYIAPKYFYGKIIPNPSWYNRGETIINIEDKEGALSIVPAVAKKAMPSVVGIVAIENSKDLLGEGEFSEGLGSGVVLSEDGYILTNAHVINNGDAEKIEVKLFDGRNLEAKQLWVDTYLDLAMIKVEGANLIAAELGDSDDIKIGQTVVAIGNPLGFEFERTVTSGIISGLNRNIFMDDYTVIEGLIQTDASINPGNSGGPLLNHRGEVIGINTVKITSGEGLGFSIPINVTKKIANRIIEEGEYKSAYMGVVPVDKDVYEYTVSQKLPEVQGVLIFRVMPGMAGEKAGIKEMDILMSIDEYKVQDVRSLHSALINYRAGDRAIIKLFRDNEFIDLEVIFEERE